MRLFSRSLLLVLFAGAVFAAPGELEDTFRKLQEAQKQNDPALVKKLAAETCALARKVIATPAPMARHYQELFGVSPKDERRLASGLAPVATAAE